MKSILQLSISLSIISHLLSCTPGKERIPDTYFDPVADLYDSTLMPFYHGVASGDPLPDRVVIWTRVTPKEISETIKVKWEIAEDLNFNSIYKSDTTSTSIKKDYTVKVDVDALEPNHVYYYRFNALGKTQSPAEPKQHL